MSEDKKVRGHGERGPVREMSRVMSAIPIGAVGGRTWRVEQLTTSKALDGSYVSTWGPVPFAVVFVYNSEAAAERERAEWIAVGRDAARLRVVEWSAETHDELAELDSGGA